MDCKASYLQCDGTQCFECIRDIEKLNSFIFTLGKMAGYLDNQIVLQKLKDIGLKDENVKNLSDALELILEDFYKRG